MSNKNKLIQAIKENVYIQEYYRLEKLLNENESLKIKIKELQNLQQEMINLKATEKYNALKIAEKEYWERRNILEENPIIKNYLTLQEEINALLKIIKEILEEAIII